jgi:hypothetical protein
LLRPDAAISGNANTGGMENIPPVKPVAKVWSRVWFLPCRVLRNAEFSAENQQCRLLGVKRTLPKSPLMSAFDPKRTCAADRVEWLATHCLNKKMEHWFPLASAMASASRKSFFCPFEYGRTYLAGISRAS